MTEQCWLTRPFVTDAAEHNTAFERLGQKIQCQLHQSGCMLQMDMLDHFLSKFYQHRTEGTNEIYDISRDSKGLLLLYILIVAVLAEDGEMSSDRFESLRECLKMASAEIVSRLR